MADDIVLKLKDHADLARHVEDAGWKLRIGNRGPEVAPNLFQDAVDLVERLRAERDAERALADKLARALRSVIHDKPTAHTDEVWLRIHKALEAHEEARRG